MYIVLGIIGYILMAILTGWLMLKIGFADENDPDTPAFAIAMLLWPCISPLGLIAIIMRGLIKSSVWLHEGGIRSTWKKITRALSNKSTITVRNKQ